MNNYDIRVKIKSLLKSEKQQLTIIEDKLRTEEVSVNNPKFLQLLARASMHKKNIEKYKLYLRKYSKRRIIKEAIVQAGSTVKLVSTKIGATIWVDATNYADLLGAKIGDVVIMHNSPFQVAGIY